MTNTEHLTALYAALDGLLTDLDANGTPESAAASLRYHLKQHGLAIRGAEAAALPATPAGLDAERLNRAAYRTPMQPEESMKEWLYRVAAAYAEGEPSE